MNFRCDFVFLFQFKSKLNVSKKSSFGLLESDLERKLVIFVSLVSSDYENCIAKKKRIYVERERVLSITTIYVQTNAHTDAFVHSLNQTE